ncbi:MAG: class I SAM-dependent methyltransferase [Actinomycetota bacterium]
MENSKNREKFDSWAKTYDTDRISSWFRYIHRIMLNHLDISSKRSILDVGCGTGNALILMSRENEDAKYFGIDLSSRMIEIARQKTKNDSRFEFRAADSANIPYGRNSFDLVVSSNSFHHYPDPLRVLAEVERVLKDGGSFFLVDACRDVFFPIKLQNIYRKKLEKGHINYYTTDEILQMLDQAGFEEPALVTTVRGIGIKKKAFTGVGMFEANKGE